MASARNAVQLALCVPWVPGVFADRGHLHFWHEQIHCLVGSKYHYSGGGGGGRSLYLDVDMGLDVDADLDVDMEAGVQRTTPIPVPIEGLRSQVSTSQEYAWALLDRNRRALRAAHGSASSQSRVSLCFMCCPTIVHHPWSSVALSPSPSRSSSSLSPSTMNARSPRTQATGSRGCVRGPRCPRLADVDGGNSRRGSQPPPSASSQPPRLLPPRLPPHWRPPTYPRFRWVTRSLTHSLS